MDNATLILESLAMERFPRSYIALPNGKRVIATKVYTEIVNEFRVMLRHGNTCSVTVSLDDTIIDTFTGSFLDCVNYYDSAIDYANEFQDDSL